MIPRGDVVVTYFKWIVGGLSLAIVLLVWKLATLSAQEVLEPKLPPGATHVEYTDSPHGKSVTFNIGKRTYMMWVMRDGVGIVEVSP